jgi:phytoene dehydrogenase-like protein
MSERSYDAVVVGAGPNGLSAGIALARAGRSVLLVEAGETVGGGCRSRELTQPGFLHDVCSAIHPMGVLSPFFRTLPLADFGLAWVQPPSPLAHPLDGRPAAVLERSVDATAATVGGDGAAYRRLMEPLVRDADVVMRDLVGPLRVPSRPLVAARFGLSALRSAEGLARGRFEGHEARALFAGCAAHSCLRLDEPASAGIGLLLMLAGHAAGWPLARGGSQAIADALARYFQSLGGVIETGRRVGALSELPPSAAVLLDVTPRQVVALGSDRLPAGYLKALSRYRYGPGVFKLDWALDGPIPWRDPACARAATVHVGGTLDEIAASEAAVSGGEHPEKPFVLVAQQSLFDPSRAPDGKQTGWAYCHVPNGSTVDMTARIEAQVERFAPGFRDRILARSRLSTAEFEAYNANYVGGDIAGGLTNLGQLFTRPVARLVPYATPVKGVYICSSSTPPGAGVHGLCGYFAAQAALRDLFG